MIAKKDIVQIINISGIEYEDLIKMIGKMDGVKIKRKYNGIRISIHKQSMSKLPVGVVIKKKSKNGIKTGSLTTINVVKGKKDETGEGKQLSAIIAKQSG